jgi:hypothetical protein
MTYEVKLMKNYRSQVFGTYTDASVADTIAAEHRSTGYWDAVAVLPVPGDRGPGWLGDSVVRTTETFLGQGRLGQGWPLRFLEKCDG